jgi:hypothetical protein
MTYACTQASATGAPRNAAKTSRRVKVVIRNLTSATKRHKKAQRGLGREEIGRLKDFELVLRLFVLFGASLWPLLKPSPLTFVIRTGPGYRAVDLYRHWSMSLDSVNIAVSV